jgi:hypothetical protein
MSGKLSDLIKFRNELNEFSAQLDIDSLMRQQITKMLFLAEHNPVTTSDQLTGVIARYQEYSDQYQGIVSAYKKIITNTENEIDQVGALLIESTCLLDDDQLDALFRSPPRMNRIPTKVQSEIYQYSNTLYPGLIIGPCDEKHIRLLTASDPLYLVGRDPLFLKDQIKNFPEQYQNRLGLYNNIELLPMNQFSIVVVSDLFCHLPYLQVIDYLQTIIRLLRPGGCVIFAFNNCDIFELAKQAELGYITFSSQLKLLKHCSSMGYESLDFVNCFVDPVNSEFTSWAMLKKSGNLSTVKRSQSSGLVGRK